MVRMAFHIDYIPSIIHMIEILERHNESKVTISFYKMNELENAYILNVYGLEEKNISYFYSMGKIIQEFHIKKTIDLVCKKN